MNLRPLWVERRGADAVGAGLAILLGLILSFSLVFGLKMSWRRILDRAPREAFFPPPLRLLRRSMWWPLVWLASLLAWMGPATLAAVAQSVYSSVYTFTTLAGYPGSGSADGVGGNAQFYNPSSVTVDNSGNVFVADSGNNTIRMITPGGLVDTIAGFGGSPGSSNGAGNRARFTNPFGVAVATNGDVYVADSSNNTIRKITPEGTNWVVTTIAGLVGSSGRADGTNNSARFRSPHGVATDNAGNIYVADSWNNTIRKITPVGTNWVVNTIAGMAGSQGSTDGVGGNARFNDPTTVAIDSFGNLYVADQDNYTVRKGNPAGLVSTLAGQAGNLGTNDGTGTNALFSSPYGVAVDDIGNVYVSDSDGETIRKVSPAGIVVTLAGTANAFGSADGVGSNARFWGSSGVAVDGVGNVYVADTQNGEVRKVTSAGIVRTIAGSVSPGSVDGIGSSARFSGPARLAVDGAGNVYVADTKNHVIREITSLGMVSTIAGSAGNAGSADGIGSDARFNSPHGVAVDSAGSVYVADSGNSTIRKITAAGVVSTVAGLAGNSGSADGTGSTVRFNNPRGIAMDSAGNVYVADTDNHTIRKVTSAGAASTLAGSATNSGSADGAGSNARFYCPNGITVDSAGNVYVADSNNATIRKVTPWGAVTTIAGHAGYGGSTDGTGNVARFYYPLDVAVNNEGNLYAPDYLSATIRKVTPVGTNWVVSHHCRAGRH